MKKFFRINVFSSLPLILLITCYGRITAQPKLEYLLSMNQPYTHYFEVSTKVTGLQKEYIDFLMPAWAPGSYLVRDFPKNVEFFDAYDGDGKELKFEKITFNFNYNTL